MLDTIEVQLSNKRCSSNLFNQLSNGRLLFILSAIQLVKLDLSNAIKEPLGALEHS